MPAVVAILVNLFVLCVVLGMIYFFMTKMPLPEPFKQFATIAVFALVVILLILWLVGSVNLMLIPIK